jgi:SAM-dependent methyltransferase
VIFARYRQQLQDYARYYHTFENSGRKQEWYAQYPPAATHLEDQAREAKRVVDALMQHGAIEGKTRVLMLRSDCGVLLARLRDEFGAREVFGLDYHEINLRYAREHYGLSQVAVLNSGKFEIPFSGQFDLIVSDHQLMHAFRPREWLRVVRQAIAPGGHLLVYNEDDQDVIFSPRPVPYHWGVVNNFHKQLFTASTLRNALLLGGFEGPVTRSAPDTLLAVVRPVQPVEPDRLPREDYRAVARAMRRVGRQFAWMKLRSHVAGLTGLRWVKNRLRGRQTQPATS